MARRGMLWTELATWILIGALALLLIIIVSRRFF